MNFLFEKVYYFFCAIFLLRCIWSLCEEKNKVRYQLEEKINKKVQSSICIILLDLIPNKTEIDLIDLNYEIYDIFSHKFQNQKDELVKKLIKVVLKWIKFKKYFIFQNRICFNLEIDDLKRVDFPYYFFNLGFLTFYLKGSESFAFNKKNFEFFKTNSFFINQIKVFNKGRPFSNCSNNVQQLESINSCIKKKGQRLSKYYYESYETGKIYLRYETNYSMLANEKECIKKFKRLNCELNHFLSSSDRLSKITIFRATEIIKELDYWVQFSGLIFLVLNISLYRLLSKFTFEIRSKINLVKNYYTIFRIKVLLINLVLILVLYTNMILTYLEKRDFPIRKGENRLRTNLEL